MLTIPLVRYDLCIIVSNLLTVGWRLLCLAKCLNSVLNVKALVGGVGKGPSPWLWNLSFEALVSSHTSSPSDSVTEPRNWVGTNLFIVHRPDDAQTDRRCHREGHLGGCGHAPAPAHCLQCDQFGHPACFITRAAAQITAWTHWPLPHSAVLARAAAVYWVRTHCHRSAHFSRATRRSLLADLSQ